MVAASSPSQLTLAKWDSSLNVTQQKAPRWMPQQFPPVSLLTTAASESHVTKGCSLQVRPRGGATWPTQMHQKVLTTQMMMRTTRSLSSLLPANQTALHKVRYCSSSWLTTPLQVAMLSSSLGLHATTIMLVCRMGKLTHSPCMPRPPQPPLHSSVATAAIPQFLYSG